MLTFEIGKRYNLTLKFKTVTSYAASNKFGKGDSTLYRYVWDDELGNKFVYTTERILRVVTGVVYDTRVTVKRYENQFGSIRLNRVEVIGVHRKGML